MLDSMIHHLGRWQAALQHRRDARLRREGQTKARRILTQVKPLRLDLGCGTKAFPGYVGVDLSPRADLTWDLRWGLPFPDGSVAAIRSDHCLEHLELPDVLAVLRQCHRVLEPGGQLEFTVPHLDPYLQAYQSGDREFIARKIPDIPVDQDDLYATEFDRLSWLLMRNGTHRSMFDQRSILAKVALAGFTNVRTRGWDARRDPNPRFSSCYVEATR